MTKLKQIEEALEASLHALVCVRRLVEATRDIQLIEHVQQAITACQDVLHDPEAEDEP